MRKPTHRREGGLAACTMKDLVAARRNNLLTLTILSAKAIPSEGWLVKLCVLPGVEVKSMDNACETYLP